ncbi:condensation domain-containing protein, partial [Streptomyces sp. NPDC052101]|uniref:condensation domain-containing protein n=1 Tax=Streptomyces sp. NPDC052101 TaxID=3155763 RepID=UPI003423A327
KVLAGLFADILNLDHVGIDDSFFTLGGHSLLAVSLIERMREHGIGIDVQTLFAAPTVAALARAARSREVNVPANGIPPGSDEITPDMVPLADLTQDEIKSIATYITDGPRNIADIYSLAPLQEGIFFHHLMKEKDGPDVYEVPAVLRFESRDLLDKFVDAFQVLVDRHDVFRTAVVWEGLREPVQVVVRHARVPVIESRTPIDGPNLIGQLTALDNSSLDIREAPMAKVQVAPEAGTGRWLALLRMHHLTRDHSSLDIMLREIRCLMSGRGVELPEPLPYRNFVAQARLGVPREDHKAYFTRLLADVNEPTAPYGELQIREDGSSAHSDECRLDPQVVQRLRREARRLGVSLAALLHVAWTRVLASLSSRDDVVFGTVLLGRMQAGLGGDRVPGLFINTLPVRSAVGPVSVAEAAQAMHAQLAELLRHEHAPLSLAQGASGIEGQVPLFTSLLNYRHSPGLYEQRDQIGIEGVELLCAKERTNYPLVVSVDDTGDEIGLTVQAVSPIQPSAVSAYMATAISDLVARLETAPDAPLESLRVLSSSEQEKLLTEWNDTGVDVPERTLPELFEAQAERTPQATAV